MATLTLSLRQEAEIVSDLSRGRLPTQIAARRHLPVMVVEACATQYGPDRAAWSRNSRQLNQRLRDEPADEGTTEPVNLATPDEAPSRFYACSWPGCEHTINWDQSTPDALVAVQQLIDAHATTHRPAPEAAEVHTPDGSAEELTPPATADEPELVVDQVAVEEPAADSAGDDDPAEAPAGSIDLLLESAVAIGTTPITDHVAAIHQLVGELRQLIDEQQATDRRRAEILAELRVLEAREAALYNELVDLGAAEPVPDAPKPDLAVSDAAVWWDLPREVKSRIRPWAVANDVPHSITGRQPAATVAAYLAAHPEDDPR